MFGDSQPEFAVTNEVGGVYSSSEYWIDASARLALNLGLPCAEPKIIALCRNKWKQRECFQNRLLSIPLFRGISFLIEIDQAIADLDLPLVVKSTQGSGSMGVRL